MRCVCKAKGVLVLGLLGWPRFNRLLSAPEVESRWLPTLTDELRDALATATPDRPRDLAEPWSRIEEFPPETDPEGAVGFLHELGELAARARAHRLYCLVMLLVMLVGGPPMDGRINRRNCPQPP